MKQMLLILIFAVPCWAQLPAVGGNWQGTLGPSLRVGLHIAKDEAGGFQATLDVIDQGRSGIPISSMFSGSTVRLVISSLKAEYEGILSSDGSEIVGTMTETAPLPGKASVSRPLIFKRVDAVQILQEAGYNKIGGRSAPSSTT